MPADLGGRRSSSTQPLQFTSILLVIVLGQLDNRRPRLARRFSSLLERVEPREAHRDFDLGRPFGLDRPVGRSARSGTTARSQRACARDGNEGANRATPLAHHGATKSRFDHLDSPAIFSIHRDAQAIAVAGDTQLCRNPGALPHRCRLGADDEPPPRRFIPASTSACRPPPLLEPRTAESKRAATPFRPV